MAEGIGDKVSGEDKNLELSKTPSPSLSNFSDFSYIEALAQQLENLTKVASVFVKGGLCPIKKEEDFIIAVSMGQQLGLPLSTSINNIIVISNKPALTTHLMRALVLKHGIIAEKVADFEPMFAYYEAEEVEGKLVAKKIEGLPIQRGVDILKNIDDTKYIIGRKEVDRITRYKFTRAMLQADGKFKDLVVQSSFKWSDAVRAELATKDTYTKYPERMLDARAFAIGAREIANDILFGMYTISELADTKNMNYTMDSNMEETIETTIEVIN